MLDLRKETFRSALAQILQILCLKYLFVLAIRNYLQPLVGSQGSSNNLSCFGSLLDSPDQQLKKDFSCLGTMPRKFLLYSGYPTCNPAVDAWVTGALHLPKALLHTRTMTSSSVSGPWFSCLLSLPCSQTLS